MADESNILDAMSLVVFPPEVAEALEKVHAHVIATGKNIEVSIQDETIKVRWSVVGIAHYLDIIIKAPLYSKITLTPSAIVCEFSHVELSRMLLTAGIANANGSISRLSNRCRALANRSMPPGVTRRLLPPVVLTADSSDSRRAFSGARRMVSAYETMMQYLVSDDTHQDRMVMEWYRAEIMNELAQLEESLKDAK